MQKKNIALIIAALVLIAAAAYVGMRIVNRGTDIAGVTTLYEKNTVIMNSKTGKEFEAGSGELTVSEGKCIHVEYALDAGSVDLAFYKGNDALAVIRRANLSDLPNSGDLFGKSGVSGKGSLDFEAASGKYTVYFEQHGAAGKATVTAVAH